MGRHVGRWFPEICFESFAQEFSQPSAKSFAQESESQNTMQPARSFRAGFSQASARSFAHRIPHEMIEASFMREALRHLPLENQMSHASHSSHTSHPKATCKARSTPHPPTKNNRQERKKQMSRNRKYKMTAISSKFSEKGGYRVQFVADGYSVSTSRTPRANPGTMCTARPTSP